MSAGLTRRSFLRAGAAGTIALGLSRLTPAAALGPPGAATLLSVPEYTDFHDIYRRGWTWDRVVHGTHSATNCVSSCAWSLYVREGIVWREEQSSPYAASNDSVPDFNPRGCQKGACASHLFLSASRLTHPLKRVGPRGAGRWKRVSWDEALDEISDVLVDELGKRGGEAAVCEIGPNLDFGPNTAASMRFFRQAGIPITDSMAMIGDLAAGGTITLGTPHIDGSSDDWFRSDYLVLWAFNPVKTRIPDAHFLNEARYGGARVVTIAPDYSQSAIHSDLWLSPRPGTDGALALAACQVILAEGLHDADYVREQSDLPFLVRTDDGRFLREADLAEGGNDARFAIWDEAAGALAWAPGSQGDDRHTLELGGMRPALEGKREITLASGATVEVEPVFARLKRDLDASSTPEQAARVTGVSADTIRRFARDFAGAGAALILSQWGGCKNYHSDLIQRSQILLASLTGNVGRAGGGWRSGLFIGIEGYGLMAMQESLSMPSLIMTMIRQTLWPDALTKEFESAFVSSTLFHAVHGGLREPGGHPEWGDPALKANGGMDRYLDEAIDKGHFPVGAKPGTAPPSVIFSIQGSVLRHARAYPKLRERLFDPARLVVDINFRISETGRRADLLLPAAGWYEKVGIKYIVGFVPYITLGDKAVEPRGESKPEWEIFSLLSQRVAQRARERGAGSVRSWRGDPVDLGRLHARFSSDERFGPHDEEAALEFMLSVSSVGGGLDELRQAGATRIKTLGTATHSVASPYSENEPLVPMRNMVESKSPYHTLTGRQQFYVDHPWFLELGEALPVHKDPPAVGGKHPLVLTGGHARWSIHAQWRDSELMLRLQRGEPVVHVNPDDGAARGISDHDWILVRNDLGSFRARAKVNPGIQPGQAHIFHAWEPYQFRGGESHQALSPSPIKVTQLVGDYGHIRWGYQHYEPNQVDRDTRVEIERDRAPA